ncbi:MAG: PQQ-like beta-propeller repeat protein [Pirellulaceae bacterium]
MSRLRPPTVLFPPFVLIAVSLSLAGCGTGGGPAVLPTSPASAAEPAAKPDAAPTAGSDGASERSAASTAEVDPLNNTIVVLKPAADGDNLKDLGTRTQGVDWPCFLGPTGDSKSPETGILTEWPDGGPRVVWRREMNVGYGVGTVSKGRYFHFDREDDQATVYCLNSETGEQLWKFSYTSDYEDLYGYSNGPRCSVICDGDRVYAYGVEGMLHCLRASDGQPQWKFDTTKEFGVVQNFFGVGSTPVVDGDLLLVMVGGSPADDQTVAPGALDRVSGNGTGIVAFDKMTGEVKYKITDELASYASLKLAVINGRRWCFAFARGGLVGFEPNTGKVHFQYPWRADILESVNASVPVVFGDQVFISETYGPGSSLLKAKPDGFDVVWRDEERSREKAMQTHWNTAIHHDGYLYGSSGRHTYNAELRCIDAKTGEVKWSVPELTRASLMYADRHFVVLGEYGHLWLIKATPEKYEVVAKVKAGDPMQALPGDIGPISELGYPCWAAPILSHGLMYIRGDKTLLCLELIPE